MKISNKIEKVQDFNFFNNELVLKTTNDDIYKGNIKFSFKGRPYAILGNRNFCDIQEEEVDFYDLGFNQLTNIKKKGVIAGSRVFNTDYFSIRWEDNKGNDFSSVYQNGKELKVYEDFMGRFLNSEYLITFNDYDATLITLFHNIIKPEFLWQYTLPERFTIFKQPQIVDNVLFFDSFKNVNEENFVVGLDLKTGKVLWQLLFKIPYKEQLLATTLHKENKLCYGYLGNLYQIFNPILGKIVFEKEMNENINPYTNVIYDNKLWFVSGKYEECKFGYINLANNELELLQDFPQEDDETFEIVYHQKKLYLRGKYYNNLYIFEE